MRGGSSAGWAGKFAAAQGCTLTGIVPRAPGTVAAAREDWPDVPVFASLSEMIAAGTCDAVTNVTACSVYPIKPNELIVQKITQAGNAVRTVTASTEPVPTTRRGWRIRLNVPVEPGERSLDSPFPFYSSNQVLLRSIIPKGVDPCDPGARYGLMVVNAADGSAYVDPTESSPARIVGGVVASSTPPGDPITLRGGGNVVIAGLTERDGTGGVVNQAVINAITESPPRTQSDR